jgi:hypothetical protein
MTLNESIERAIEVLATEQVSIQGMAQLIVALCALARAEGRIEGIAEERASQSATIAIWKAQNL